MKSFIQFINEKSASALTGTESNEKYCNFLPNNFTEIKSVIEKSLITTEIKGESLSNEDWDELVRLIQKNLKVIEIYSEESNGSHFKIYHKK